MRGKPNPRQKAARRRKGFARKCAMDGAPCAICHGMRGPIHYDEPRDHRHPLSLAIDERAPVARWREYGYASAEECACDPSNWQPTHWICNSIKGDGRRGARRMPERRSDTF